ncbi:archease [Methanofollis fontis]|uniref:Protein archease n=1 Tax=Methanofollis fontis TaxID=2052832 RepID=A0A483CXI0_9EURY|nr:archease [Methanofollis fontis]TAJ43993.1 protein archease [Methanofollis fontis]
MPFFEVPHQADVKVHVEADTCGHLFSETARAMFCLMYCRCEEGGVERRVSVTSTDRHSLMIDFLSELLFIAEVERLVFSSFDVTVTDTALEAVARGERFDPAKHRGGMEIKGVSYSGLRIFRDGNLFCCEILFDV